MGCNLPEDDIVDLVVGKRRRCTALQGMDADDVARRGRLSNAHAVWAVLRGGRFCEVRVRSQGSRDDEAVRVILLERAMRDQGDESYSV